MTQRSVLKNRISLLRHPALSANVSATAKQVVNL